MLKKVFDVIICGAGPGGVAAGIYAARGGLSVAIIEKQFVGGQAATTFEIENYPGFENISGSELSQKLEAQAVACGCHMIFDTIMGLELDRSIKEIYTEMGEVLKAKAVVLAFGARPRDLGINAEQKFLGRGVSYCATCDGAFYKEKTVAVVGGGNTAVEDAIYLTRFAKKVYLIHRREGFRADKSLLERLRASNVDLRLNNIVVNLKGLKRVEAVEIRNVIDNTTFEIQTDGVFVAVGRIPQTELLVGKLALDEAGYVLTDEFMKTNIDGVFCCGDMRAKHLRQVVTACADGAIAGDSAIAFINETR